MEQIEQIEQAGGNKQSPANKEIPECKFQSCNWIMTYHNYPEDIFEQIEQHLVPLCKKYVFGKEVGKSGKSPHIQGAFILKKKMRQSSIWKLFGTTFFLDKMGGSAKNFERDQAYCIKEGLGHITNVKFPKPLKKLMCEDPENQRDFQKIAIKVIEQEADDRSIFWFWGSGNIGKTEFGKFLHRKYGAICLGGKSADMKNGIIEYRKMNGILPERIVINLPRSFDKQYLSYTGIEEVKDMFFYSGKFEGGMVDGNCPHLLIFSNEFPDIKKCSLDRWNVYNIDKNRWDFKDSRIFEENSQKFESVENTRKVFGLGKQS